MANQSNPTCYLKDYQPPSHLIDTVHLDIDCQPMQTRVFAHLTVRANPDATPTDALVLQGEALELVSLKLNGQVLSSTQYQLAAGTLTLPQCPPQAELVIETLINPADNQALSGLYVSGEMFCTQCEAEGFRRITYYLDRPDVMAVFTTTLRAPKATHPVLLANGNCVETGDLPNGRHYATWHDPFKKPCYLFAMVAGNLIAVEDHFLTQSGKLVTLKLFVEHANLDKTGFAMQSLKKAMAWDEQAYGREYDLDNFLIVAVNDFNMGAMENKGLNIFNSQCVLGRPETTTDTDFEHIEAVVGHEYFHNWSGNRVTCRDWFQLSLKEGFTVLREQQFTESCQDPTLARLDSMQQVTTRQFAEDAGPLKHPVQPDSYQEINNFYTLTIYEKGAELIRMLHTLLGAETFRQGADHYFQTYDGQAVTIEELMSAMEHVSQQDLTQFRRWYKQPGTPELEVQTQYDAASQSLSLTLTQANPGHPNTAAEPLHIPVRIGALTANGEPMLLEGQAEQVVSLTETRQQLKWQQVPSKPVISLLRGFSAPVKVAPFQSMAARLTLLQHDACLVNRWREGRAIIVELTQHLMQQSNPSAGTVDAQWVTAMQAIAQDSGLSAAVKARLFRVPGTAELITQLQAINPQALQAARQALLQAQLKATATSLDQAYATLARPKPYVFAPKEVGERAWKNVLLEYLVLADPARGAKLAVAQYEAANNMTEALGALQALNHTACPERDALLQQFITQWGHDKLVTNKWFGVQARSELPHTLDTIKKLLQHTHFNLKNPNNVYALIGGLGQNPTVFHAADGSGYQFLAEIILELDGFNPQVAARMVAPLAQYKRFHTANQQAMVAALQQLQAAASLSKDTREMVDKSLVASQ